MKIPSLLRFLLVIYGMLVVPGGSQSALEISLTEERSAILQIATEVGKSYWLESSESLLPGSWFRELEIAGDGEKHAVERSATPPGPKFWRLQVHEVGSGDHVFLIPDSGSSPLLGVLVSTSTRRGLYLTVRDEDRFGDRYVSSLQEMAIETSAGWASLRFNVSGIPYQLELPGGEKITFDVDAPDLHPRIPGVPVSAQSSPASNPRASASDGLRDQFLLIPNPISKEDLNAIANLGIENVAGPIIELINYQRGNLDEMLGKIIQIAARHTGAAAILNQVLNLRDEVLGLAENIEGGVAVADSLLEGIESVDFNVAGWQAPVKSKVSAHPLDDPIRITRDLTPRNGFWSAVVAYPRDPSYDDEVWSLFTSQIDLILAGFDRNVVDVQVRNSGFQVIWNRIRTDDFGAIDVELRSLYGAPPWRLAGPWFYPD